MVSCIVHEPFHALDAEFLIVFLNIVFLPALQRPLEFDAPIFIADNTRFVAGADHTIYEVDEPGAVPEEMGERSFIGAIGSEEWEVRGDKVRQRSCATDDDGRDGTTMVQLPKQENQTHSEYDAGCMEDEWETGDDGRHMPMHQSLVSEVSKSSLGLEDFSRCRHGGGRRHTDGVSV